MNYTVDGKGVEEFKNLLAEKLLVGCQAGAEELQNYTPIDTKRLFTSTRAVNLEIHPTSIACTIRAGGVNLPGELREVGINRDVDYAIFVEVRTGYITENLGTIGQVITDNLT
jgi:hypothetical protein